LTWEEFRDEIIHNIGTDGRIVQFFHAPLNGHTRIFSVIADDAHSRLNITSSTVDGSFDSLSNDIRALHIFEREIFEETGIIPNGHPWLKPVRYPETAAKSEPIENYPFFRMEGSEVHEVAVGPVHAGIIEPGHFRFQCDGENVHHLEIQLGYQHRGLENLFLKGSLFDKTTLAESIAGDTVIGHASAFTGVVQSLSGVEIPRRAVAIEGIAAELERIAIHLGDLSAVAGDIAYLSGNSVFGALRTMVINSTQALCGNRFGRGLLAPGGVRFDIDDDVRNLFHAVLENVSVRTENMCDAMFSDPGVLSRLEKTGIVDTQTAKDLAITGPAARSSGLRRDARADHPYGAYALYPVYARVMPGGDVFARAYMKYLEIQQSADLVREMLDSLPDENVLCVEPCTLKPGLLTVSMTEGWRGEIVHCGITGPDGELLRYKIKDPSFSSWTALALAVRDNGVSDFPLCNKSFNLSYCGFDL
jgi:Ni,Fe-hydrogenase III large subunit